MWFDSWSDVLRTLFIAPAAGAALVVMLRITGGRTLAQLSTFDMIVTVALGSTLATILLSSTVSCAEGILALAILIALQSVVTWASTRARWVQDAVRDGPALLHSGGFLHDALLRQRVTPTRCGKRPVPRDTPPWRTASRPWSWRRTGPSAS